MSLTIDTHCHVGADWFEPVEVLLFQMDRNDVDRSVLIQMNREFDNTYVLDCVERHPGRFAAVGSVDIAAPDGPAVLKEWAGRGMQGIRYSLIDRASAGDPLPVLRKAEALGMKVSCLGLPDDYASDDFRTLIRAVPDLPIMIEHLAWVKDTDEPPYANFTDALSLAEFPNIYMKVHGLGEIMSRPAPMRHPSLDLDKVPPFIDMAIDAFGADRLMFGTDSPPCSHREGYANVVGWLRQYLTRRSPAEQAAIFGGTAAALFSF